MTEYQRRYRWARTWPDDPVPAEDYVCIVDGERTGRIVLEWAGQKKGLWRWNVGHSRKIHAIIMPQQGHAETRSEAVRIVEEHYDAQRKMVGLPPAEVVNVNGA